ncbi:MAG: hypothetical protein ABSC56_09255 [Solirubrobacteraceae bacterium]|jgi:hypothetical protein
MFQRFDKVVRCSQGHLYTSTWMWGGSLKALRLGNRRFQRCPVGHHWSMARLVDPATLSPQECEAAAAIHDVRVP